MPRSWIYGEKLLCSRETPQGIAADRDQIPALGLWCRGGEFRRDEYQSIDRAAHRRDPADFIHCGTNDGKVKPLVAPDVAEENLTDMQRQIHRRNWMCFFGAACVQSLNSRSEIGFRSAGHADRHQRDHPC